MKKYIVSILSMLIVSVSFAEIQLPKIFADNMEMLTPRGTAQSQGVASAPQAVQPQPMAGGSVDEDLPF